jgi:hypothetical protein
METIRQVYEHSPDVITIDVPEELRDRRVEVIVQPLKEEPTLEELAARWGMKLEEVKDLHGLRYAGSIPDFPPREPQGEYEVRQPFPWE